MLTLVRTDSGVKYLNGRTKTCRSCYELKSINDFSLSRSGNIQHDCSDCVNAKARKNRKNNPDRTKATRRKSHLKRRYSITPKVYDLLFEKQEGKCSICGKHSNKLGTELAVDHDHVTGEIRGLLCSNCNLGLGIFKDNYELLKSAAKYINGHTNR